MRRVYHQGRQFNSEDDLRKALYYEWSKLEQNYVQKLIFSMSNKAHELLKKRCNVTRY